MSTGIVILAAGESARMGEPKQLLAFRGTTLLQHVINTALSLDAPVVVVLGAHAAKIRARLDESSVIVAENSRWRDGMGGSLRAGLGALIAAHPEVNAAIFLLGDQPLVSAAALGILVAWHEQSDCGIVASEYDGTLGVPALFSLKFFPELLALDGKDGARQVIASHRDQVIGVVFPEGAVDIDTPADYAGLRGARSELITSAPV